MTHSHQVSTVGHTTRFGIGLPHKYRLFGRSIDRSRETELKDPEQIRSSQKATLIKQYSEGSGELPIAIAFRRNGREIVVRYLEDLAELEES